MKKLSLFLGLLLCLSSCTKENSKTVISNDDLSINITRNGIDVMISKGAPFATKGDDGDFLTFSSRTEEDGFIMVNEQIQENDGNIRSMDYSQDGTLLATYLFQNNELLDFEPSPLVLEPDMSAWYNKGSEEKYRDCVKRVYREAKRRAMADNTN